MTEPLTYRIYRYLRLIGNCISHWTLHPVPLPDDPSLSPQDVTIIIPTLDPEAVDFVETLRSCLSTNPYQIIISVPEAKLKHAEKLVLSLRTSRIRLVSASHANKRRQMCRAIEVVQTRITVFADDDVTWPQKILHWMLAPLEEIDVGGVGTCQRLRRADSPNIWHFLNAIYLERRNFDISATTHMDGGIPCLSGRTVAYRTQILQDPAFMGGFTHEKWRKRYQLNADDDNYITRWLVSHGWKISIQYCKETEVKTTLEGNPKFLKQCLRWSRSNWRSNLTSMFRERHIWWQQPWSAYAVQLTTITQWAFIWDPLLIFLLYKVTEERGFDSQERAWTLGILLSWMFLSKFVKLLGHFIRYPEDIILLPVSICFGYFHGFIKVYAMLTLNETAWGSRDGADEDNAYRMIRLSRTEHESI
ncbi:MAG: hypothetical protein M1827_006184 [Pycnora praestabilis]|nr:MAG: hypothetical protein M1827_006184 [Pycnora praestabilis]